MIAHFDVSDWGTISEWTMAAATVAAAIAAFYYIKQNRDSLAELKRQNDISSEPLLRISLREMTYKKEMDDGKHIHKPDAIADFTKLRDKWKAGLKKLKITPQVDRVSLVLCLSNKGRSTITSITIEGEMSVRHLEKDAAELSRDPMTAKIKLALSEDLDEGGEPVYVPLIHIDNFPEYKFEFQSVIYEDARGKSHALDNLEPLTMLQTRSSALELPAADADDSSEEQASTS